MNESGVAGVARVERLASVVDSVEEHAVRVHVGRALARRREAVLGRQVLEARIERRVHRPVPLFERELQLFDRNNNNEKCVYIAAIDNVLLLSSMYPE